MLLRSYGHLDHASLQEAQQLRWKAFTASAAQLNPPCSHMPASQCDLSGGAGWSSDAVKSVDGPQQPTGVPCRRRPRLSLDGLAAIVDHGMSELRWEIAVLMQPLSMTVLKGFAWILVFQCLGEVIAQRVSGLWPGPVIGMLSLAFALTWRPLREPVSGAANALLPHLSLLFVPIGVGVLLHTELIVRSGWALLAVLALSTWVGMVVTAIVLRALWKPSHRKGGHE